MIAFYITAHGYGHAGRSLEVITELEKHEPVTVVSEVPEWFFRPRFQGVYRPRAFDCGLIQKDSVRGDVPATLLKMQSLMARSGELLEEEREFLRQTRLVVVDSPSLPLQAARAAGIPGVALTSFGWDYIYRPFAEQDPAWNEVCEWFRQGYAQATLALQYPFSAPIQENPEVMPLVARPGRNRRAEIAAETGADPDKGWAVVWFHDLEIDPRLLGDLPYELFTRLDWPQARHSQAPFADLVASADVVVTKPGFGILSDCIANGKPIVYVPRDDFSEAFLLEEAIQKYTAFARIEAEDLYAGNWLKSLEQARAGQPLLPPPPQDGAAQIARRILRV
ncbi:MAG: hypothetical protein J0I12_21735 [Candidatus Eremiobacteraeota bacterium]|nr:hypothetical protein [Candidatus Eremiobacteraeota bacterium]